MKKRPFILIEILIACAILGTSAVFLMSKSVMFYRAEMASFAKIEKQRLADLAFAEVKVLLLRNEITWKKLPAPTEIKKYRLSPVEILSKPTERRVLFKCRKEKTGLRGEVYRLLEIEIQLEKEKYVYKTIIRKL